MSLVVNITDYNFIEEVVNSKLPVLVDFWAPWCGPCKQMSPVMEEVALLFNSKIKICKMNVDENRQTPRDIGIKGIPTFIIFNNGNTQAKKVGTMNKEQMVSFIKENI